MKGERGDVSERGGSVGVNSTKGEKGEAVSSIKLAPVSVFEACREIVQKRARRED